MKTIFRPRQKWVRALSLALAVACSIGTTVSAAPSPADDPAEPTVWPNQTSRANSDRWLIENHDHIRVMRPRLLVLNFSNRAKMEQVERMTADLIAALAESNRYHGYRDSNAPAFLQYQVFKAVDFSDGTTNANSALVPLKPGVTNDFNVRYSGFFEDTLAARYGVPDPKNSSRFLRLDELVDGGYVHEVFFFCAGDPPVKGYEVLSTIEDWRIGSGPDGKDVAKPWINEAFARYRNLAADCDGQWLVYWRQNIPGLGNKQRDDSAKPMKNWWPFLFY
jgi:hypothetical protein